LNFLRGQWVDVQLSKKLTAIYCSLSGPMALLYIWKSVMEWFINGDFAVLLMTEY